MFTIYLRNSSGGELDRKTGERIDELMADYAREGCLSGGDTLSIYDHADELEGEAERDAEHDELCENEARWQARMGGDMEA